MTDTEERYQGYRQRFRTDPQRLPEEPSLAIPGASEAFFAAVAGSGERAAGRGTIARSVRERTKEGTHGKAR